MSNDKRIPGQQQPSTQQPHDKQRQGQDPRQDKSSTKMDPKKDLNKDLNKDRK